jgi:hypothetical protein
VTRVFNTTPDENSEGDDNKDCEVSVCQGKATNLLDLPFGEYASTILFLCIECKKMIENMETK